MKTKYTYKQIWTIAYPILISLIMEQLIGHGLSWTCRGN